MLEFQMVFESLLEPAKKIDDERTAALFDKFQTKMNIYIAQNASFLQYSRAQMSAACLLLTMKLCNLLELYDGSYDEPENVSPTMAWDPTIEKLTGLLFKDDIQ